jgi:hypothetical protein
VELSTADVAENVRHLRRELWALVGVFRRFSGSDGTETEQDWSGGSSHAGESVCRPGSVTSLSVTWKDSPKCWLTCGFTSHGFSSDPVSFHALAEQRRNWRIPSRVWADGKARAVVSTALAGGL